MAIPLSIKRSNFFGQYHIHVWHGITTDFGDFSSEVIIDKIIPERWFKKTRQIYSKEFISVGAAIDHAEQLSREFDTNPLFRE